MKKKKKTSHSEIERRLARVEKRVARLEKWAKAMEAEAVTKSRLRAIMEKTMLKHIRNKFSDPPAD